MINASEIVFGILLIVVSFVLLLDSPMDLNNTNEKLCTSLVLVLLMVGIVMLLLGIGVVS